MRVLVVLLATVALAVLAACGEQRACSNGVAVRDPEENPGLVQDCVTLLTIKNRLPEKQTWTGTPTATSGSGTALWSAAGRGA